MEDSAIGVEIREASRAELADYGRVPIAFRVDRVLDITADAGGELALTEQSLDTPYTKDYDAIKDEGPTRWAERWDLSRWGVLAAFSGGERVGGAVLAFDTPGVNMLEARRDLTVMWDLRVHPDHRRKGVGTVLFWTAESWAAERGCTELKVETQNINVAACRFYARQGCQLGEIQRHAYPDCPGEVMMFWRKRLGT